MRTGFHLSFKEGGPVFRSDEDSARLVRERGLGAAKDLKAGRTKSLAEILAGQKPTAGR